MSLLLQRRFVLTAGKAANPTAINLTFTSEPGTLDFECEGEMDTTPDPDVATFTIYNLNADTRAKLEAAEVASLSFGYATTPPAKLFSGDVTFVGHDHVGTSWVTKIMVTDGGRALRFGYINAFFPPKTSNLVYFQALCASFNAAAEVLTPIAQWSRNAEVFSAYWTEATDQPDNVKFVGKQKPKKKKAKTMWSHGLTIAKKTRQALDNLCDNHALIWFIHGGTLFVIPKDNVTLKTTLGYVDVDKSRGMLGVPSKTEAGGVSVRSLLRTDLHPGGGIKVTSEEAAMLSNCYRINKVQFAASNFGEECAMTIETGAP